jgi:mono/diheme cytochrome c family protein
MRRAVSSLAVLLAAAALVAAGCGGDDGGDDASPPPPPPPAETGTTETNGDAVDGAEVFVSAGCGSCHAFEPAGSSGSIGPSLDGTSLSVDQIEEQVRNGGGGMPPFEDQLSEEEIAAVAEYVASG